MLVKMLQEIKRLNPKMQVDFQNNIDIDKLSEIDNRFDIYNRQLDDVNQDIVDSLLKDLGEIFVTSGKITLGTYIVREQNKNSNCKRENKPWFDMDCKFARQNYRKLKKRFKHNSFTKSLANDYS